ncbi:histidine kinase [Sulfuricurvum kujiense DSM 16994]|uniref:histidine kinase n=1 Tax=Sulfuricurvum kujiense (strain ATCC BAA-921 / DSM 16994 / JCM 11577 / YK-1) TaxID=709032 RepID=E4TY92_SULKY|nr:HAMP domain-containing sensor histidine kinase [Sulfuricurvum kujiense]ADR34012.1 histidine kinase [Sulfuricurvum kujiense DSM 16994]
MIVLTEQDNIAYACMNSIGNSLVLEDMLTDVISTFISHTEALGGKYILSHPLPKSIVSIENDFDIPDNLSHETEKYMIYPVEPNRSVLDIPIGDEHFLFAFEKGIDVDTYGTIFASFKTKLAIAIEACRSVARLHEINSASNRQILEAGSKQEATEQMLMTQSRMAIMGEIIGMIAHQWRQPISVIGMIANNAILTMMTFAEINQQQLLRDLNIIDQQIHDLSSIIDDFHNFFRPAKIPQTVTLHEISNGLITVLGITYKNIGINLSFECDENICFVTYKNELMEVFLNILANAKEAFEERRVSNPFIRFKSFHNSEMICFTIQDNAGGIDKDIIDKIFDPYFSTKKEKNGTGLGLYISAVVIEKHLNGSIRASCNENGSVFSISIPINQATDTAYGS